MLHQIEHKDIPKCFLFDEDNKLVAVQGFICRKCHTATRPGGFSHTCPNPRCDMYNIPQIPRLLIQAVNV